jgi:hypothetical protein
LLAFLALSRKPTPGSPSPEALDAQAEAVMPAAAAKVIAQHKRHAEASAPQPRPPIVVKIAAIEAKAACGSEDVDLCRSIVTDAVLAYDAELDEKARAAIAALKDITPRNAREALIARRMLALDAMSMESLMRDLERTDYGNPKACRACPLRARCTNDARSVFRLENEDVLDRMAERLKARPTILMFGRIDPHLRRSITFDNDTAFAQHALLRTMRDMTTWFCDAYASWQKGGIENANGRLRRWLPRHLDIDRTSDQDIQEIVLTTNLTPRKCLGFKTPFQALIAELGKDIQIRFS